MDRTLGYWLIALVAVVAVTTAATGAAPQQAPAPTPASERLASFATREQMEKASLQDEAEAGINVVKWDMTLDVELAKKAEETRKVKPSKPFEPWMTWFVELGSYTLEVAQGARTEKQPFKVVRGTAQQSFFEFVGEPGK